MELNYSRSLHIRKKAVELLKEYGIDTLSDISIANLLPLLKKDITHQFANLRGLPGFTCYDQTNNRYRIFLDSITYQHCPQRTNFIMAHELGHIMLGHFESNQTNSTFIGHPIMELEANHFADEILMPSLEIIKNCMSVKDIVTVYKVSVSAAINKKKHLRNNSLFMHEINKRRAEPIIHYYRDFRYVEEDEQMQQVNRMHERWLDPDYDFYKGVYYD